MLVCYEWKQKTSLVFFLFWILGGIVCEVIVNVVVSICVRIPPPKFLCACLRISARIASFCGYMRNFVSVQIYLILFESYLWVLLWPYLWVYTCVCMPTCVHVKLCVSVSEYQYFGAHRCVNGHLSSACTTNVFVLFNTVWDVNWC